MNHEVFKQMKTKLAALSDSRIELDRKIDSWSRLIAQNQRENEVELARLQQQKTGQISPVQQGTVIASESGKWFAGGTQMPDTEAMLNPDNLQEMLQELDATVKKRRIG